MPYEKDSDVPTYVPQEKRAQWREVFNSVYKKAIENLEAMDEADKKAFAEANSVAGPNSEKLDASFQMFIPLQKADESRREVYGLASIEKVDKQGEIFDYASSKPYVQAWSDEIAKASGGRSLGNVREMHARSAVGKIISMKFDDASKSIAVGVKIVDEAAWHKVEEGVYTGFSFGGTYVKRWPDGDWIRYTARPFELTIADNPCVPGANFQLVKADGTTKDCPLLAPHLKKSETGDESMTPEEKQQIEKTQADVSKLTKDMGELRKLSEGHKVHLEAMAHHHAGLGHHLGAMLGDAAKAAGLEVPQIANDLLQKSPSAQPDANGFVVIGKTAEGIEIFKKVPVDPNAAVISSLQKTVEELNKNFGEFVKAIHDGLESAAKERKTLPGVVRSIVGREMTKVADGGKAEDESKDDGKPVTSAREAAEKPEFLKTVFSKPLGSNEIEMIRNREREAAHAAA